jgi:hypothetical protein
LLRNVTTTNYWKFKKYYYDNESKQGVIDRTCSTYEKMRNTQRIFRQKSLKGREHWQSWAWRSYNGLQDIVKNLNRNHFLT